MDTTSTEATNKLRNHHLNPSQMLTSKSSNFFQYCELYIFDANYDLVFGLSFTFRFYLFIY